MPTNKFDKLQKLFFGVFIIYESDSYRCFLVVLFPPPSLGIKQWEFLTLQKKSKSDLNHLQSDNKMFMGKDFYLLEKVIFEGFRDSTVVNIHGQKELQ